MCAITECQPSADRICQTETIPSLAALIDERSSHNPFGWSWQPESRATGAIFSR